MSRMTKKEVLQSWFDQVWTKEDTTAIRRMFTENRTAAGLGNRPIVGAAEFESFQQAFLQLLSDIKITQDLSLEKEEWIMSNCTMTGRCRKSGKAVNMSGFVAGRLKGDQIIEAYNSWEFMQLFEQLGLLPENTFLKCLTGEGLNSTI